MDKILFICSSLEPQKDGVGDYTRFFAQELAKRGYLVEILALNDVFVGEDIGNFLVQENGVVYTIHRLGSTRSSKEKKSLYSKIVEEFQPDVISFQYVPHGFHKKGLPFYLANVLKLNYRCKVHMMIHEPFIEETYGIKDVILKKLQIVCLKKILNSFRPNLLTTSIKHYARLVQKELAVNIKVLPLFGNIPVSQDHLSEKCKDKNVIEGVFFGSLPKRSTWERIVNKLLEALVLEDFRLSILLVGRSGSLRDSFCDYLIESLKKEDKEITIKSLGEKSEAELSMIFTSASFGISRVPAKWVGKSGTAVSMLEHGLRLWIPLSDQEELIDITFRKAQCYTNFRELILSSCHIDTPKSHLPKVAGDFLESLNALDS